jgi:hypothetical protein
MGARCFIGGALLPSAPILPICDPVTGDLVAMATDARSPDPPTNFASRVLPHSADLTSLSPPPRISPASRDQLPSVPNRTVADQAMPHAEPPSEPRSTTARLTWYPGKPFAEVVDSPTPGNHLDQACLDRASHPSPTVRGA